MKTILALALALALVGAVGSALAQAAGVAVPALAPATAAAPGVAAPGAAAAAPALPGANAESSPLTAETDAMPASTRGGPPAAGDKEAADASEAPAPRAPAARPAAPAAASQDETEFQRFVKLSTGRSLPLFGYNLFSRGAVASPQGASVPSNYVLGPGDEVVVQTYGMVNQSFRLVIDREGRVQVPRVGPLTLAGLAFGDAERVFSAHFGKVYREFNVAVTMGRVRNIEVFVVGQARQPGKVMLGGLSTLINALFESGGPNANGSLRAVELRRAGKLVARMDIYQFLARGDDSGDAKLQAGDVIFIPPAGPRVAVLGTVNLPAIFELKPGETIENVLALSGGLPVLAAPQKVQLERIRPSDAVARYVEYFALDAAGLARALQSGDMLTIYQISPKIADVVTLQGNVAAPMRYSWQPGMRISDLLSDPQQLIPTAYWTRVNSGSISSNPSRPEVNLDYATIQRLDAATLRTRLIPFNPSKAIAREPREDLALESGDLVTIYRPGESGPDTNDTVTVRGAIVGGTRRFVWRPGFRVRDIIPNADWLVDYYNYWQRRSGRELFNDINWGFAQVVRRMPTTLQMNSINFSLGGAVLQHRAEDNLELQPGDQIALFTTREMPVPMDRRIQLVTLGGEVQIPGVYQLAAGETLEQIVQRAGGFTANAYPFGLDFRRETTRVSQQENLDRLVQRIETQIASSSQSKLQNVTSAEHLQSAQAATQADQLRLTNLRNLKASGRLALRLDPDLPTLPTVVLEDGDTVTVPSRPAFVGVFGAVNNDNALLWRPGLTVDDAIAMAGATLYADLGESYVLRADGTVLSNSQVVGRLWMRGVGGVKLQPGDTVVVPEKGDRESFYTAFIRGAKDITSILYQFGIGAAALKTLRN